MKEIISECVRRLNGIRKDHILHCTIADNMAVYSFILGLLVFGRWFPGIWAALLFSFVSCSTAFFGKELLLDSELDWTDILADYLGYVHGLVKIFILSVTMCLL